MKQAKLHLALLLLTTISSFVYSFEFTCPDTKSVTLTKNNKSGLWEASFPKKIHLNNFILTAHYSSDGIISEGNSRVDNATLEDTAMVDHLSLTYVRHHQTDRYAFPEITCFYQSTLFSSLMIELTITSVSFRKNPEISLALNPSDFFQKSSGSLICDASNNACSFETPPFSIVTNASGKERGRNITLYDIYVGTHHSNIELSYENRTRYYNFYYKHLSEDAKNWPKVSVNAGANTALITEDAVFLPEDKNLVQQGRDELDSPCTQQGSIISCECSPEMLQTIIGEYEWVQLNINQDTDKEQFQCKIQYMPNHEAAEFKLNNKKSEL
ncbi:hypothetical protein EOPP23_14000 [Endozoicomonas sp. OPT23]|uniref:hypothetical protein n=1 Tax=Endozoicomonas sp. OPT23 TaxID=2072845 RepID=UPI00129B2F8C|nr:hypothetical protein [Endozoicomonas sp. OPT23]MRI34104.1 hypothetical protein [Endozoicomonas sp. OPT23]